MKPLSSLATPKKTYEHIVYPCLMISDNGNIWLLHTQGKGTKVKANLGNDEGYYNNTLNMSVLTIYSGTVVLKQE